MTTVREVGGPLLAPSGGEGTLRVLGAGPTITSPGGYPIPVFPEGAVAVTTEAQARQAVRDRVAGGAVVIKVGLDRGGEPGAPWSDPSHGPANPPPPWSLLDVGVLRAIVNEAHQHGRLVTAHVGEPEGVQRSLDGGVDEWAHMPCNEIPPALLQRAVTQGVKIVGTLDTLSHCQGLHHNTRTLASFGATFLYGAEVAHNEIPWGIDAQELHLMRHLEGLSPIQAFRAATSAAGRQLGLAPLGTLTPGAPADLIAVPGDPFVLFKPLEYPGLVMSGGKIVVNDFTSPGRDVSTARE